MRLSNAFILRGTGAHQIAEGPYDEVVILRRLTLSGSAGTVDLSEYLYDAAVCKYILLKEASLSSGVLTVAAAVPGATDTVWALITTPVNNIKSVGE